MKNYNVIIPPDPLKINSPALLREIELAPNLNSRQKLLAAEIVSLSEKQGYCSETNKTIAEKLGIHRTTVSADVSNMKRKGYLRVKNNGGEPRHIFFIKKSIKEGWLWN